MWIASARVEAETREEAEEAIEAFGGVKGSVTSLQEHVPSSPEDETGADA